MAKLALLIGVSEYEAGLNPLPGAVKDIDAMQRVLQHREMGGFDQVKTLSNPEPTAMQEAIETLFSDCKKEDLALLFFSGHGVKDESGRLYFATRTTRKNPKGDLVKATAVPAGFVQDIMGNSRSKRQIVILDCCFSGAFADGMMAKDDGRVDVQTQLGGEGRAVLTSSTSTQYSFEQEGSDLSVYTRYFVEGIETGAADTDRDGLISIDELHEYTQKKVQETTPAMKPKIYAVEEGFKIRLAQAPTNDPQLSYRREVERFARRGEISKIGRTALDACREELALSLEVTQTIEVEVLKPYQERQRKLQQYEQVFQQAVEREKSLSDSTREELKHLQKVLGLRGEDISKVEAQILSQNPAIQPSTETPVRMQTQPGIHDRTVAPVPPARPVSQAKTPKLSSKPNKLLLSIGLGGLAIAVFGITALGERGNLPQTTSSERQLSPSPSLSQITTDVEAGPIWSNEDAKLKCPVAAKAANGEWNGQWKTTVQGKASVCGVVKNH